MLKTSEAEFVDLKYSVLTKMLDVQPEEYIENNMEEIVSLRYDAVQGYISANKDYAKPLLGQYVTRIFQKDLMSVKDICDRYINLIYFCLRNDNHKCIYWILREFYTNVYSVCEDEKKKEELLDLFVFCLYKKNEIKDMRDINNLILHVTETIIRNGKVSFATEDFIREVIINGGEYIQKEFIHLLSRLLNGDMGETFTDVVLSNLKYICINTEDEYIKNEAVKTLHNIADRTSDKKKVFSVILRIASDCVENGYDRALRECFNAMGWIILESIRCRKVDDNDIEYMFRRTEDIYTAAKSTGASERTVVFMLTLFTTLGMFCYQNFNEYLDIIYKVLRCEKEEKVRVAMKLRLDDSDEWDGFFRNDDENKEAFLKLVYSLNNQH